MAKHKKWIGIVGIGLMLLAMFAYVASYDEEFPPAAPNAEQGAP